MITFIKDDGVKVSFEMSNESTLDEMLCAFELFLRAAGYTIEYNKALVFENMDWSD